MNQGHMQINQPSFGVVEQNNNRIVALRRNKEPSSTARFVSSLTATVCGVTVSSPFDVLRTRLQVQKSGNSADVIYLNIRQSFNKIFKSEGIKGFFRGYKATLMTTPVFHSVYFPLYESFRWKISQKLDLDKSSPKVVAMSSGSAGIIWNVITNPFWLVRTRMQAEVFRHSSQIHYSRKYKSIIGSVYKIYSNEGFFALYAGLSASILGLSHVWIYFPLYEALKSYFKTTYHWNDESLSSKFIVWSSISAKLMTSWITYPHEVVRSRQQDIRSFDKQSKGLIQVIKTTFNNEGLRAFYKGFSLNLLRMLPQNAIIFLLYENLSMFISNNFES